MNRMRDRYDVVVAGARVAGAATAMLLARRGLDVLVVDPTRRGSDTLSTHALMRGAVVQLQRWGVLDEIRGAGTPVIESTTFHYGDELITVDIKARDGIDGLYAPRRTVLDSALGDAASRAGAEIVFGAALTDLVWNEHGRVTGAEIRTPGGTSKRVAADLVIGADGVRSKVARLVRARPTYERPHKTASIYAHVTGLGMPGYHWFYGDRLAMGTIPTNDDQTCVFASLPPERFEAERGRGLAELFREITEELSPDVTRRIEASPSATKHRGFAGETSFLRKAFGPGWALVGDAGYFKDPLTAHGMTDAMRDAELLARAAVAGSERAFEQYESSRDELSRPLIDVTAEIASFDWTLEEAKDLHMTLAQEMKKDVEVIREWDTPVAA